MGLAPAKLHIIYLFIYKYTYIYIYKEVSPFELACPKWGGRVVLPAPEEHRAATIGSVAAVRGEVQLRMPQTGDCAVRDVLGGLKFMACERAKAERSSRGRRTCCLFGPTDTNGI